MAVEWTVMDEIRLLRWVSEYKPVGIHKHFHMMCILERMNHPDTYPVVLLQKEIIRTDKRFTARDIWLKLSQYYNLGESDKLENDAFKEPTEPIAGMESDNYKLLTGKSEFSLPWDEYSELILKNAKRGIVTTEGKSDNNITNAAGEAALAVANSSPTIISDTEGTKMVDIKSPSLEVGEITREEFLKAGGTNEGVDNNGKVEANGGSAQPSGTIDHLRSKSEEKGENGKEVVNERTSEEPAVTEDSTNVQIATKSEENDTKQEDKTSDQDTAATNKETGEVVSEPLEEPLSDDNHNKTTIEETTLGTNKKEEVMEEIKEEVKEEKEEENKGGAEILVTAAVNEEEKQEVDDNLSKEVVEEIQKVPSGPTEKDNQKQGEAEDNKENPVKETETNNKASEQHTVTATLSANEPKTIQENTETGEEIELDEKVTDEARVGKESITEEPSAGTVETEAKEGQEELEEVKRSEPPEREKKKEEEEASLTKLEETEEKRQEEGKEKETETVIVAEKSESEKDLKAETKPEDGKPLEVATEEAIPEPKPTTVPEEEPSTLTTRVKKRRKRDSDIFQASSAIIGGLLDDEPLAKRTRHSSASNSKVNASGGTNIDSTVNPKDKNTTTAQTAKGEETNKKKKRKKQKSKKNEKRAPARGTRSSSRLRNNKSSY